MELFFLLFIIANSLESSRLIAAFLRFLCSNDFNSTIDTKVGIGYWYSCVGPFPPTKCFIHINVNLSLRQWIHHLRYSGGHMLLTMLLTLQLINIWLRKLYKIHPLHVSSILIHGIALTGSITAEFVHHFALFFTVVFPLSFALTSIAIEWICIGGLLSACQYLMLIQIPSESIYSCEVLRC